MEDVEEKKKTHEEEIPPHTPTAKTVSRVTSAGDVEIFSLFIYSFVTTETFVFYRHPSFQTFRM